MILRTNRLLLAGAASVMLALAGCVDNDSRTTQFSDTYTGCFNAVTDIQTGLTTLDYSPAPKYTMVCEQEGQNAYLKLSMVNVNLASDLKFTSFTLPELPMTISATDPYTPYLAQGANVKPESTASADAVTFDDVTIRILRRMIYNDANSSDYRPVYTIAYSVNGRYMVNVIPEYSFFFGSATVTDLSKDENDVSRRYICKPSVNVQLNPSTGQGSISLSGLQLNVTAKEMNMTIPGVPFSCNAQGLVSMVAMDAITPNADGAILTDYPVTDLGLSFSTNNGGTLTFVCTTGADATPYRVDVTLMELSRN